MQGVHVLLVTCCVVTVTWGRRPSACDSDPCLNGGTCRPVARGNAFRCVCPSSFSGDLCQVLECDPPCENGALCNRRQSKCVCPEGLRGEACEVCVDEEAEKCPEWAKRGDCNTDRNVRHRCRSSCKTCPGDACTAKGEYCVHNAFCNQGRQCQCDPNLLGDGRVLCADKDDRVCVVRPSPQLVTFDGAEGDVSLPCRYRLAHVTSRLTPALRQPGKALCKVEVFGYNLVTRSGHVYPDAAEVRIAIGEYGENDIFRQLDSAQLDFGIEGAVFSTDPGSRVRFDRPWHETWNGIDIACLLDVQDKATVVEIPACNFRLQFRSYNESREDSRETQTRTPSIAVVTGHNSQAKELDKFPNSLCGEAGKRGMDQKALRAAARKHNFDSVNDELLFNALGQNIPQRSLVREIQSVVLQNADACQRAVDLFSACGEGDERSQVKAIKRCAPLLSSRATLTCLCDKVMDAFAACLSIACSDDVKGSDVSKADAVREECGRLQGLFDNDQCPLPAFLATSCKHVITTP